MGCYHRTGIRGRKDRQTIKDFMMENKPRAAGGEVAGDGLMGDAVLRRALVLLRAAGYK